LQGQTSLAVLTLSGRSDEVLRAGARTSENSVKAKFAEFPFHALE
jgi:hypothetical protein